MRIPAVNPLGYRRGQIITSPLINHGSYACRHARGSHAYMDHPHNGLKLFAGEIFKHDSCAKVSRGPLIHSSAAIAH